VVRAISRLLSPGPEISYVSTPDTPKGTVVTDVMGSGCPGRDARGRPCHRRWTSRRRGFQFVVREEVNRLEWQHGRGNRTKTKQKQKLVLNISRTVQAW